MTSLLCCKDDGESLNKFACNGRQICTLALEVHLSMAQDLHFRVMRHHTTTTYTGVVSVRLCPVAPNHTNHLQVDLLAACSVYMALVLSVAEELIL